MTPPTPSPEARQLQRSKAPPLQSSWWPAAKLMLAILITSAVLVLLVWFPFERPRPPAIATDTQKSSVVQLAGRLVTIQADSALEKKLAVAPVEREKISSPLLTVTGSIVARLRPGAGAAEDRWQFNTPELLSVYTDFQKSRADVDFAEKQLVKIRQLNRTRVTAQEKVVERLRKLVAAGTDSKKDLAAEETTLKHAELQEQKEVFEAETAVRVASRSRSALERQLLQAGADPNLLSRASEGTAIVVADVPEAKVGLVREGHACLARFYGYPRIGLQRPGRQSVADPLQGAAHVACAIRGGRSARPAQARNVRGDRPGRRSTRVVADSGRRRGPRRPLRLCSDGRGAGRLEGYGSQGRRAAQ